NDFYVIMAELASTPDKLSTIDRLDKDRLRWLETQIDLLAEEVEPITDFVQSGDSKLGALIDVGRTVVRRAERRIVDLQEIGQWDNPTVLKYFNRLSSLLFLMLLREVQRRDQDTSNVD
ncbi:MAG: ATP:cob(I)alamin adenosyltransferase, partial [Chloroflexota bacterium]